MNRKWMTSMALLLGLSINIAADNAIVIPTHAGKKSMGKWNSERQAKRSIEKSQYKRYYAAFSTPLTEDLISGLKNNSAKVVGNAGKIGSAYVYVIKITSDNDSALSFLKNQATFWNVLPVTLEDVIEKNTLKKIEEKKDSGELLDLLVYVDDISDQGTLNQLKVIAEKTEVFPEADNCYRISIAPRNVSRFEKIDGIKEIVEYQEKQTTMNYARKATNVDSLQSPYFTKAFPPSANWLLNTPHTGDSVWICINESGSNRHQDFYEINMYGDTILRTTDTSYWGLSDHGTHVAGIAAGNGWLSHLAFLKGDTLEYRGIAPKALIIPYGERGDVNNHSFTEGGSNGYYNWSSSGNDARLSNHSTAGNTYNNVGVFATANNGINAQYGVQKGYYSLLVNNKNGIKVGGSEKRGQIIAYFSSIGPTRDGRIGPDVIAPASGTSQLYYQIEMDSVAILNNGPKVVWNFSAGDPTFGSTSDIYKVENVSQNGTISFNSYPGGYFWSDNIYPAQIVTCSPNDTLVLRIRAMETVTGTTENMYVALLLKRPSDSYHYDGVRVGFQIPADGNWHDVCIPLNDSVLTEQSNITWGQEAADTIQRIRFDWGVQHLGVRSSVVKDGKSIYDSWTGTSMACPHVTGIVALMLQKYRDSVLVKRNADLGVNLYNTHDTPFWNSTARAILVHTATDIVDTIGNSISPWANPDFVANGIYTGHISTVGPDWATGFGLVNALKAVSYVDTTRFIEDVIDQGATKIKQIHVTEATPFRVTLCWDDLPNTFTSEDDAYRCKLVNDLDLYLQHRGSGRIVYPWTLDHSGMTRTDSLPNDGIDSAITPSLILSKKAYRGIDTINNLEVVDVESPDTGIWDVYVKARSITGDQSEESGINQDFSLVSDIPFVVSSSPAPDSVSLVMSFERPSLWSFTSGTGSKSYSLIKTHGKYAMQIQGNGYQEIKSINLQTTKLNEKDYIKFDLFVGSNQPNPYWYGLVQLYVSCPSAYIYNQHIGQAMLDPMPLDSYNTVTIALPSNVKNALAGNHNDFSFSISINTNPGSGPYYLDNLRFSN